MEMFKRTIKRVLNRLGFDVLRLPYLADKRLRGEYEPVRPAAMYAPWKKAPLFQEQFAAVRESTLVDQYRCYELWHLVGESSKLPEGDIIEIGVWRGGTGALIAKKASLCGIPGKVFLCDTFTGVVKAGVHDASYRGGEHADTSRASVETFLRSRMKLENIEILEGIFPDQTGHAIESRTFRFCHIDVDVYQSAKDIVDWIWDKLIPGGFIVFDDYGFPGCSGIAAYVDEQMKLRDRVIIHNLNGHAILIKR